jgi:hypothetical protein
MVRPQLTRGRYPSRWVPQLGSTAPGGDKAAVIHVRMLAAVKDDGCYIGCQKGQT